MLTGIDYSLFNLWQNILQNKTAQNNGWGIILEKNVAFLKSPTDIPNLNLCLNPRDESDVEYAFSFFNSKFFGLITDLSFVCSQKIHFKIETDLKEMFLPADNVKHVYDVPEVIKVKNEAMLNEWVAINAHINQVNETELYTFMRAMLPLKEVNFFITYHEDKPIGVGQVFIDDHKSAYVSSIGVLNQYRKQGIGTKIMNKILYSSLHDGAKTFNLHATEMGAYLYDKLEFQLHKNCSFKIIEKFLH